MKPLCVCIVTLILFNNCGSPERAQAEKWFNSGNEKLEQGDNLGAIEDFTKAIEIDSTYAPAYSSRGGTKMNLGDPCGAIKDFDKAIEKDPDYERFYIFRGLAKLEIDENESACADFTKAQKMGLVIAYSLFKENCQ